MLQLLFAAIGVAKLLLGGALDLVDLSLIFPSQVETPRDASRQRDLTNGLPRGIRGVDQLRRFNSPRLCRWRASMILSAVSI